MPALARVCMNISLEIDGCARSTFLSGDRLGYLNSPCWKNASFPNIIIITIPIWKLFIGKLGAGGFQSLMKRNSGLGTLNVLFIISMVFDNFKVSSIFFCHISQIFLIDSLSEHMIYDEMFRLVPHSYRSMLSWISCAIGVPFFWRSYFSCFWIPSFRIYICFVLSLKNYSCPNMELFLQGGNLISCLFAEIEQSLASKHIGWIEVFIWLSSHAMNYNITFKSRSLRSIIIVCPEL